MAKRTLKVPEISVVAEDGWQHVVRKGIEMYFTAHPELVEKAGGVSHTVGTPDRFVKYLDHFAKVAKLDPNRHLVLSFPTNGTDEMIAVYGINANSYCCHHLLPVMLRIDFAYINSTSIVGLSKIPRFIKEHAAVPQTQEQLTRVIGEGFQAVVNPKGVAVAVTGLHTCMACRGVETPGLMRTTYLNGPFRQDGPARGEFLSGVVPPGSIRI